MNIFDRLLIRVCKWRLARFRYPGDTADRLGDNLLAIGEVLRVELERRNKQCGQWARAARAVQAARASRRQLVSTEVEELNDSVVNK